MEIDVRSGTSGTINIGRQGENAVKTITFDYSVFVEEFGDGVLTLVVQRRKDDEPYPVLLETEDNKATWTVTSTDTAYKGTGKIQLSYVVDEQIKKSVIYKIKIEPSVIAETEEPPEPIKTYLDQMIEIGSQVQSDAEDVREIASDLKTTYSDDGYGNIEIQIGG